mmetsp:Transcript_132012/g.240130  ORF Transcript_132012/g.240130 Transcript_132012/m.240130 type:complete len:97 (+) Transcript_132012:3014-3304(+)
MSTVTCPTVPGESPLFKESFCPKSLRPPEVAKLCSVSARLITKLPVSRGEEVAVLPTVPMELKQALASPSLVLSVRFFENMKNKRSGYEPQHQAAQ